MSGLNNWLTYDERRRNEGLCMTTAHIAYGLITNAEFRKTFEKDWREHHHLAETSKQAASMKEFVDAQIQVMTTIQEWLDKAENNTLDRDFHASYKIANDIKRAKELLLEFANVKDMHTLTKKLADYIANNGEYSRLDVRNSLNNTLVRQFLPEVFLPSGKNSKKDVFSEKHTQSGFLLRTEIKYTAEQVADKLFRPQAAELTSSKANATAQKPTFFGSSSSSTAAPATSSPKAKDDKGKQKDTEKRRSPSLSRSDEDSSS